MPQKKLGNISFIVLAAMLLLSMGILGMHKLLNTSLVASKSSEAYRIQSLHADNLRANFQAPKPALASVFVDARNHDIALCYDNGWIANCNQNTLDIGGEQLSNSLNLSHREDLSLSLQAHNPSAAASILVYTGFLTVSNSDTGYSISSTSYIAITHEATYLRAKTLGVLP